MYIKNLLLVGAFENQIPDLDNKLYIEFKVELESGNLQSIKTSQNKGNLVTAEYEYLDRKTITANNQKIEEINFRIRVVADKQYKENLNKI